MNWQNTQMQMQMTYMQMQQMWMQMMLNMFQAGAPAIAPAAGAPAIAPAAGAPVVAPGVVIHIVPVRRRVAHNLAASQVVRRNNNMRLS